MLPTTSTAAQDAQMQHNPGAPPHEERLGLQVESTVQCVATFEFSQVGRCSWPVTLQSIVVEGLVEFASLLNRRSSHLKGEGYRRDEFLQQYILNHSGEVRSPTQICHFVSSLRTTASDPILISIIDAVSYIKVQDDSEALKPTDLSFRGIFGRIDVSRVYVTVTIPAPWSLPWELECSREPSFALAPNTTSSPHQLYLLEKRGPRFSSLPDAFCPSRTLPPPLVPVNLFCINTGWVLAPTAEWEVYSGGTLVDAEYRGLKATGSPLTSYNTYECCFPPSTWAWLPDLFTTGHQVTLIQHVKAHRQPFHGPSKRTCIVTRNIAIVYRFESPRFLSSSSSDVSFFI
ncbi:hypothetical protein BKA70DRAFT_1332457 [Coprinopsis sp. MPI-PUGE-AT-0042]|nr:hypothetical protein BKA70DRAFT_1332457 [Coprinopsis sp. MPI-PUGE-AT-0042]